MLSEDTRKLIKKIEIRTKKIIESGLAGEYLSAFKGHGMEFAEVREYIYGDDIRAIDWNVTAKTSIPHVKVFQEEREQTIILAVDLSPSLHFGSREKMKEEVAAEISALLAFSAIANNDKVGLIIFSDFIEKYIPVAKGKQHVLRIIKEILSYRAEGKKTSIKGAIELLNKVVTEKAIIFFISDFLDTGFEKELKILARRNDVIAVRIYDRCEFSVNFKGFFRAVDPETRERAIINTADEKIMREFNRNKTEFNNTLYLTLKRANIPTIDIEINSSIVKPLIRFFKQREKKISQ